MIVLVMLCGLLLGITVDRAADALPRFLARHPLPDRQPRPRLRVAVAILTTMFLTWLWGQFDLSWTLLVYTVVYTFFLLVALIDLKYRLVLNVFTYPAIATVLAAHLLAGQNTLHIFVGGVVTFLIFFSAAQLRPGGLGGGDIKLATLIGFLFGFPELLWALLVGAGIGGIAALALLASSRGSWKTGIPYAPFLCLGAMVALLYNPFLLRG